MDNKKRLAVIAGAAFVLFLGVVFIDELFGLADAPDDSAPTLTKTEVPRTPIAGTVGGRMISTILEDESFQGALPESSKAAQQKKQKSEPWPNWLVDLIQVILVILAVFTVVVFIWVLFVGSQGGALAQKPRKNIKRRPKSHKPVDHHMVIPAATLKDVERLAEEGRYGDAVRILLSIALTSLAGRDLVRIIPSMTGREIAASATIGAEAVARLTHLVLAVEVHAFAGEGVNRTLFEECLAAFQSLASLKDPV